MFVFLGVKSFIKLLKLRYKLLSFTYIKKNLLKRAIFERTTFCKQVETSETPIDLWTLYVLTIYLAQTALFGFS